MAIDGGKKPSGLDRLLGLFSDVRAGEGGTVLLMTLNIFLVLVAYYIIKVAREPLILGITPQAFLGFSIPGGAELKSYGAAGQALVLMAFVPFYSWFSSRVDRMKLIIGVLVFFIANILFFSVAIALHQLVGFVFFIWVGIFSLSVIAQFWSYANDIYEKEEGDRLFPIIGIGMVAGAPAGSFIAGKLFSGDVNVDVVMYVAAAVLALHLGLFILINRRVANQSEQDSHHQQEETKLEGGGGFSLVLKSRYLLLIAALLLLLNVVNTTGEFILGAKVSEAAKASGQPVKAYIGTFYGDFFFIVNIVAFFIQAVVVSRLVKYTGIKGVVLLLPFVSLGAYGLVGLGVGLSVLRWAKTAENATDYSVMNTAKGMLWLPTSREEKYKAKQAIDTFVVRLGDVASAALVYVGINVLSLSSTGFARANVVFIAVWIVVGIMLVKKNAELTQDSGAGEAAG